MITLKYPISTERAISMIDRSNTIVYMVDFRASKESIKKEFESTFKVKVAGVRTANTPTNEKKAFIKIAKGYKASDVASKLKLV
jgi:large subunit ribosomal protein L23